MTSLALLIGADPPHRHSVHRAYADAIWAVGVTPVLLAVPPPYAVDRFVAAAMACDGIVLSGGGDVDPASYGEETTADLMSTDPDRDAAELAVVRAAREGHRPLLGICRGVQVLAVAAGGRLHQHLPAAGFTGHWAEERQHDTVHAIRSEPGSVAETVLAGVATVNSIHHQGVADPGGDLTPTAWSGDGLIEALEADGVLGIQWHPERLASRDPRHLAPFRWVAGLDPATGATS
ncbi:MAG: gamma-glutamyl-gamma-aminobutyrate hydrolase family protein [Acidimicrobiales bacterium]